MIYDTIYNYIFDVYHMQIAKLLINKKEGLSFQRVWGWIWRTTYHQKLVKKFSAKFSPTHSQSSLSGFVVWCKCWNRKYQELPNLSQIHNISPCRQLVLWYIIPTILAITSNHDAICTKQETKKLVLNPWLILVVTGTVQLYPRWRGFPNIELISLLCFSWHLRFQSPPS